MTGRTAAQLAAIVAVCCGGSLSSSAMPSAPGSLTISLSPVYAYVVLDSSNEPAGGGGGLSLKYALSESVSVDLFGQWTGHQISPAQEDPGGLYQIYHAALGASYAFDVISVSPVLEGGLGVLHHRYQQQSVTNLALRFGLAADMWVLDWLGVGAAIHYHAYLTNPAEYPAYFDVGPRLSLRWEP